VSATGPVSPSPALRVSCIIPAWNAERYLAATLRSVLAQTRVPDEVIVVDDGSTDSTATLAAGFGSPVRVVRQDNAGPAAARNRGIAESSGDLLAFVDADDLWEPVKLERQIAHFVEDPELGYSVTGIRNFVSEELGGRTLRNPRLLEPMVGYSQSTLMARRCIFAKIGTFDTVLGHADSAAWFLRTREAGLRGEVLPDVLVHRRLHEANRSQQGGASSRDEHLDMVKAMLDRRRAAARERAGG
jgi:glycosyltransferase involved in cell wall biosynthesis